MIEEVASSETPVTLAVKWDEVVKLLLDYKAKETTVPPMSVGAMDDMSLVASLPSMTFGSSCSSTGALNACNIVANFAKLLCENKALQSLFGLAAKEMKMDRFERNFARMLAAYSTELRTEAQQKSEVYAARLVRAGAKGVASRVRLHIDPEKAADWAGLRTRAPLLKDQRVEDFVMVQHSGIEETPSDERRLDDGLSEVYDVSGLEDSEHDSHNSDNDDGTPTAQKNTDIDKVKHFFFASVAFQQLLLKVAAFISPIPTPR